MKKGTSYKKRKRKSLFLLINVSFIILNIISIITITVIVYQTMRTSINSTITTLENNIYKAIYDDIDFTMSTPLSINEANHRILKYGDIDLHSTQDREHFFTGILTTSQDTLFSASYITEEGEYFYAQKNNYNKIDYKFYSYIDPSSSINSTYHSTFDPRTKDWYILAKYQQKPVFSVPTKSKSSDDLIITAAYPIYDDKGFLQGVLATHVNLEPLNNLLESMLQGKLGNGYIVDKKTGRIIANSNGTVNYKILFDGTISGLSINDIEDEAIQSAYNHYLETSEQKFKIKSDGNHYHISINEYRKRIGSNIDWLIITSIPENLFTSALHKNYYKAFLLCKATAIISIILTFLCSRVILNPIRHLVVSAEKLSKGELSVRATVFRDDEIGELARTFNHMADEINAQINTLEDKITERTSELEDTNQALIEAMDQALAASTMKSQFLANMSHEIRTPMNGISGFLHLLEQTELSDEQADYVRTIASSTESLLTIVNDLLDLTKIESGKMILEKIPFEIIPTIEAAIHLFDVKANSKGLEIYEYYDPRLPSHATGDPTKLKQIICNLISNAVKFTEKGGLTVNVNLKSETNDTICIFCSVADSGIGLSPQEINKLFVPFSQADASSTRKYGGTGLGLAICKNLIEMMQGEIHVQSMLGEGSVFSFQVILQKSPGQTNAFSDNNTKSEPDKLSSPPTNLVASMLTDTDNSMFNSSILLVEDNDINIKLFVKLLKARGLTCDLAVNGIEALGAYERKSYDIIFMDCQMPLMDGFEATRRIRALEGNQKHTIIIALTAYGMAEDKAKCKEAGMDEFINKPIQIDRLQQILSLYLKSDNCISDLYTETIDALAKETGFDQETCVEIIDDFYEHGLQALENIRIAFKEADSSELGTLIHKLKGAAGTVRAKRIADLAAQAEAFIKKGDQSSVLPFLEQIEQCMKALKK